MIRFFTRRRNAADARLAASSTPRHQHAAPLAIAEPLEERRLFAVVVGKSEPLNNGGVTYTGGIATAPRPTPVLPASPTITPTAATGAIVTSTNDDDDTLIEARTLKIGTPVTNRQITSDVDVDMYKISLVAGQVVGFDIDNLTGFSTFDSQLRIFDGLGNELDFSDNNAGPNEVAGLEAFIEFTAAITGTYFVGVAGDDNANYDPRTGIGDVAGDFGPYILRADLLGETDTDDQIGEARSVKADDTKDNQIFALTDVDMYRLSAKLGQRFLINVDARNGSLLDSALQIFDASGNIVGADYGGNTFISFVAPANGNYYIAISGNPNINYDPFLGDYNNDAFGSTGAYRLRVDKQ